MPEEKLPTPQMVMAGATYERQQLAKEIADRAKDPLSEAKREGGFYLRADGTPVDANDKEIEASKLTAKEKADIASYKATLK